MNAIVELSSPVAINLDKSKIKLFKGENFIINASLTPTDAYYNKLIWESSDETIATVSQSGEITAKGYGKTTITVKSEKNENVFATCEVNVLEHTTGIYLNPATININIGEKSTLSATTLPEGLTDNEVTWASSNESVAKVDAAGNVTAIQLGSCIITATSVDGGFTAECKVNVVQPVTGIDLSKHLLTMKVGNREELKATLTPDNASDKSVIWSSKDNTIAEVNNRGVVTAKSGGNTFIYACSASNPEVKDSCEVEVVQAVASIAVTPTEYRFKELDETLQLDCTIQPEDATNKNVTWKSSDANVCTVSASGLVTATGWGKATVTATTEDGGHTATCTILVKEYGVPASAIVWNETEFVYTGKAPQPTWANTYNGYEATAAMPELEKNAGEWEATVPFTFKDEVDEVTVDVAYRYTIKPAVLTVTALDAERYEGEENPEFVISYEGFVNNETKDVLTQEATAYTEATIDSPEGTYPIMLSGAEAANYEMNYVEGTLTVIFAGIEVTADAIEWNETEFVYTGKAPQPTWTNTVTQYDAWAEMPELEKNAGTWETEVPFWFSDGKHTTTVYVPLRYTIKPAILTVRALDAERYVGDNNPEFVISYEGFVNGETKDVLTREATAYTEANVDSPEGSYPIMVSGAEAANYEMNYVEGWLSVIFVGIDVPTFAIEWNETEFVYTGEAPQPTWTNTYTQYNAWAEMPELERNAGTWEVEVPFWFSDGTNTTVTYVPLRYTIMPAMLTVKAVDAERGYGEPNPVFEIAYEGFVNGETPDVLYEKGTAMTTATEESPVGEYPIRVSGVMAQNYQVTEYIDGVLNIVDVTPTDISQLDNVIYAEPATGVTGSEGTLTICLKNNQPTNAYSFDLKLPYGVTLATDADNDFIYELSERHNGHSASVNYQPSTGLYSVAVLSLQSKEIKGNDGAVISLRIKIDDEMAIGNYGIYVKNSKLSLPSGTSSIAMPQTISQLAISDYRTGDVNNDAEIDIADAVAIVNYVVGKESMVFKKNAADVNGDTEIDIADAVRIVNLVVGKIDALSRQAKGSWLDPQ